MAHAVNWFEIPVKDLQRAKTFYESILDTTLHPFEGMGMKSAFFPADFNAGDVGGCLVEGKGYEPSDKGALIYLNAGEDLAVPLSKVEKAGGKVVLPKTSIGEHGFMAYFMDTEGNRLAFHSNS